MKVLWWARPAVPVPGKANRWQGLVLNSAGHSELCPHEHRSVTAADACADRAVDEQREILRVRYERERRERG